MVELDAWQRRWSRICWRAYLQATQPESSRKAIRDSTFGGRLLDQQNLLARWKGKNIAH